jgi:hypothetical protein
MLFLSLCKLPGSFFALDQVEEEEEEEEEEVCSQFL